MSDDLESDVENASVRGEEDAARFSSERDIEVADTIG